jgi:hypothetical protein
MAGRHDAGRVKGQDLTLSRLADAADGRYPDAATRPGSAEIG